MKILVCIDDTDNIDSRGTGELASMLAADIEDHGWGTCEPVTRHQMLVHPDIAYTSHNSAMCFGAEIDESRLGELTAHAREFLVRESASGSDPGLCIVPLDGLSETDDLITFGKKAKQVVIAKEEAYALAERIGVHLSEHGGTGIGVIGALAGTGLRLTGNDGRFRGHFKIETESDQVTPAEIMRQTHVEVVKSLDGDVLNENETIVLGKKVKSVLQDGKSTLLVYNDPEGDCWRTCTKQQLKVY